MGKGNKVVVVGDGYVGSATAFTLMQSVMVEELVITDLDKEKVRGDVLDLNHGKSFVAPMSIKAGDYDDFEGADIIIITAGRSLEEGETRLDLAHKNGKIVKGLMEEITKRTEDAIILMVSNPVDVLNYGAYIFSHYDRKKIIGSGTLLDSVRLRFLLGEYFGIDSRNIHGYILGEHGDSEVAAWSITNIVGRSIEEYCQITSHEISPEKKEEIQKNVIDAGYEVIDKKGGTCYGIALSIKRIVEAILGNENTILTVSAVLDGEYGLEGVSLSVPCVINRGGIERILPFKLAAEEEEKLLRSSDEVKKAIERLDI